MNKRRIPFFNTNSFQKQIFWPSLMCILLSAMLGLGALFYIDFLVNSMGVLASVRAGEDLILKVPWLVDMLHLRVAVYWMILLTSTLLLISIAWVYFNLHRVLGAYTRVVREMDEYLAGEYKGPIKVRKGDEMFENMLQRINAAITRNQSS